MNNIKLALAGSMIITALLLSFINNKKVSKVELTKYFESKEGYGDHVLWIDQEQWISTTSGLVNLWRKDKLKKTFDLTFYDGKSPVYNSRTHKLFVGTYIIDLAKDSTERLPSLSEVYTEGMSNIPRGSAGSLEGSNFAWDKEGKQALVFSRYCPSRAMETTSYSGIKGRIQLIDPVNGKLIKTIWESKERHENFLLLLTDKYLIAAGTKLLIFDRESGNLIKEIEVNFAIRSLAFHPSKPLLATGKADGKLEVYKVNEGWKPITTMAHTEIITSLAFHPTLDLLVSGAEDKKIKIWKLENENLVNIKEEIFDERIQGLSFDPTGKKLAVSQNFNTESIQMFEVKIQK